MKIIKTKQYKIFQETEFHRGEWMWAIPHYKYVIKEKVLYPKSLFGFIPWGSEEKWERLDSLYNYKYRKIFTKRKLAENALEQLIKENE